MRRRTRRNQRHIDRLCSPNDRMWNVWLQRRRAAVPRSTAAVLCDFQKETDDLQISGVIQTQSAAHRHQIRASTFASCAKQQHLVVPNDGLALAQSLAHSERLLLSVVRLFGRAHAARFHISVGLFCRVPRQRMSVAVEQGAHRGASDSAKLDETGGLLRQDPRHRSDAAQGDVVQGLAARLSPLQPRDRAMRRGEPAHRSGLELLGAVWRQSGVRQ